SVIRRAIVLRIRFRGTVAPGAAPARTPGGAGAEPAGSAPWTSRSTPRPPGPVPLIWDRSSPASSAIFRATGEALTRASDGAAPSPASGTGPGGGDAGGAGRAGAGG